MFFGVPVVGHSGLDPGTLRPWLARSQASMSIRLSWSETMERSPASPDDSSRLLLRLHNWLHELGPGVIGVMQFEHVDGTSFEMRIEG